MEPMRLPMDFGGVLLNVVVLLVGVLMILSFTALWSTIGGLMALLGFFNVRGEFNRPWWIFVALASGEEFKIERKSNEQIQRIYKALRQAIDNR